jgi:DNA repair protein RecO (recombination protein O)
MRVMEEPAFVLHSIAYKETSLILDVFTRHYGRIALVAKGAKRPHSSLRPVLQQFQPLQIHFTGKLELKTLTKSEWQGGVVPLTGDALLCGFYMNELIVKFSQGRMHMKPYSMITMKRLLDSHWLMAGLKNIKAI